MLGNARREPSVAVCGDAPWGSMPWRAAFQASSRTTASSAGPGGRIAAGVVAEHGDPDRPRVVALDVGPDDAQAGRRLPRWASHPGL